MKILFVDNNDMTFLCFRKELFDCLIGRGDEVILVGNFTEKVISACNGKCKIFTIDSDLKSVGIINNINYIKKIQNIICAEKPDIMLTFTIKPNLYSNWKKHTFPSIANITGLGKTFQKKGLLNKFAVSLYRKSFKNVDMVFFQNTNGLEEFSKSNIPVKKYRVVPGSGINVSRFAFSDFDNHKGTRFLFASRFIEEKGFDLMVKAIPLILEKYPDTQFYFLGENNKRSKKIFSNLIDDISKKNITILPFSDNMEEIYKICDYLVSPSFYKEGISNVLLESLAVGRPIITTKDNPGCADVLVEGKNGFGVLSKDLESLIIALQSALKTPLAKRKQMAYFGRKFVEDNFDRKITNKIYLETIDLLANKTENKNKEICDDSH